MSLNVLIWNARGVANVNTQSMIKRLVKDNKIMVLAIIEPMVNPKPDFFSRVFGLSFKGVNCNGQIWVFVAEGIEVDEWDDSEQILHARFITPMLSAPFFISVAYEKCFREGRIDMWIKLRELAAKMDGLSWLVGGDFNIFVSEEERQGSKRRRTREMMEFAEAISDCQLLDIGADGPKFTWARDHCPLLIVCRVPGPRVRPSFRFQNMWVRHHLFLQEVERCWREDTGTRGLINLQLKLSRLKRSLKIWNRVVFGNILENLRKAEFEAKKAMENFEQNPSPLLRAEMNRTSAEFILSLKMEEDFWRQKATLKWVAEGERNTKFFHGWVKQKRVKSRIHMIEEGGQTLTEEVDIRNSAEFFFKNLLTEDVGSLGEPELEILSSLPADVNLSQLEVDPTAEEVRQVVFDINADSTAGPDGFSALFFQACWDIVGKDVVEAVVDFFAGAQLPRGIAATLIVLVPKKKNPTRWADFRPISLCNVMNKIISKLITKRLAPFLPLLTVPNQSGFIRGRLLSDNVLLAKEMFHEIWKCVVSPNMVLKLDMEKAYDRVQWPFLLKVLKYMGFSEKWEMMYRTARYTMGVSHLAYADDIIIFSQARSSAIVNLMECLRHYMQVLGQKVNVGKSCFFLDKKHYSWAQEITEISGFQQGSFPFSYLGVPIYRGPKKTSLFLFLRDKISSRIHGWSHRHLSFGGRLTLLKSVLGAIPIHIFQVLEPTKGALRQIEQVMARFLWGSCNSSRKTHWIKWQQVCLPTDEGGLGIRGLADSMEAFSIKLWWRFREQGSLWASYMYQKYCSTSIPMVTYRSNRFSPIWRRMFKVGNLCREQIRWVIGEGNISFWHDSWWNEMELWLLADEVGLADEIVEDILQVPINRREKDRGRWKFSGNGNFSIASAWELVPSGGGLGINLDLRFRRWQRYLNICSSQHLSALLPYLILWAIWTERNENVHRNKPLEAENVIRKVSSLLRNLVLAKLVGPEQWRDCSPRLEIMNGQVQEKSKRRTRMVLWRPPDPRWVKLNVDGAFLSSSQVGGGGGVVRDSEGEILSAFSAGLKAGSGLEAEAAAVLIGIHLAKQFGNQIWIELDSEVVVRWLTEDQLGSADSCIILAKIRRELGGTIWRASHIFREGNKVADLLAKIGLQSDSEIIYTRISTPPRAKALCRMDQWGLPNFRF
ncbi:uncharacterized protein LOC125220501 [Salvia hispanica]|uniref:uncharacterized protein LOC125220501 n=1 Tax=Salvia hispanica TaxID=49212 RepID=UPI0020093527|nr:uncharacterized protein LOC125220501 [Salvia hispanica]